MLAKDIISDSIPYLFQEDDGDKGLMLMQESAIRHIAVVDKEKKYIGIVSEEILFGEKYRLGEPVGEYVMPQKELTISPEGHIFEVLKIMQDNLLSIVPVINDKNEYKGVIGYENIIHYFGLQSFIQEPGGILVLETEAVAYSVTELSRIIEQNGVKIIALHINNVTQSEKINITLKLNSSDLASVIETLERFEYTVLNSYQETQHNNTLQERYDSLIKYLSI